MSPVAEALEELMGLGVTGEALVAAIRRIEQAAYGDKMIPLARAVEIAAELADKETSERRRADRERKAAKREESRVSEELPTCPRNSAEIQDFRGPPAPLPDKERSPTPPKEINPTPLPPAAASETRARASADEWAERLNEAHRTGGDGLNLTTPALHSYRDLKLLCEPDTGTPCSWSDVLDAIGIEAAKARDRGKPIRSWLWVHETALANRDRRLAGLPEPRMPHERPDRLFTTASERRQSSTESSLRAAALAIERRRGAGGGGFDGAG